MINLVGRLDKEHRICVPSDVDIAVEPPPDPGHSRDDVAQKKSRFIGLTNVDVREPRVALKSNLMESLLVFTAFNALRPGAQDCLGQAVLNPDIMV